MKHLESRPLFFDSKTILQGLTGEEGPDHDKSFRVAVYIGEKEYGAGSGHTKKAAEQVAAYQSILKLRAKNIK